MPNVVFKNEILEKEFNIKGYVKVPFLSSEEIDYLKEMFFDTIEQSGGPKTSALVDFDTKDDISYDFTFIDKNIDYKQKVYDIITAKFQAKADEYLNNYTPIIANYIRKKEGGGEVPMHQNWAFVDEVKYTSVSIWVPLVDSNEENGTLQMVDGSHKRFGQLRGPMIPWELRNLKDEIISKHLTPMNVKAGEGVILDDSIVHYSNINKTPGLRLAIQLIMIPKESTSLHYHFDRDADANKVTVLETNVNFYTNFHPWLKPIGLKELRVLPYKEQIFSYEDFLSGLNKPRFDEVNKNTSLEKKNSIAPLFINEETQTAFDVNGYVKIPLLNTNEVEELKKYYLSLNHNHIGEYGFHVSLDNSNEDYINGIFNKLFDVLVPKLNPLLCDYKPFTASYVIKEAGLQNIVPPHQDWSFVDEEQFCSATVWIPLMDVNKNNGALGVIKGSQKLFNEPRTSPSPQSKSVLSDHLYTIFPYVDIIDMKAGEALIFNNRTIHASPPNISGKTRIGVGIGITQKNAQLLHYYQLPNSENAVNVYKVDEAFFKTYNNKRLSDLYSNNESLSQLELINTYKKSYPIYSNDEIINIISSIKGINYNTVLVKELSTLYQYNGDNLSKTNTTQYITTMQTNQTSTTEKPIEQSNTPHQEWVDPRTFFEKYSIPNIIREIKFRLGKK